MNKPVLVIMAAGMGSRYGGLKQMDPIGPAGELIIDYSLYDAKKAGFETAVCIIKKEIEADFKAIMEKGAAKYMNIKYVMQDINNLPAGFSVPEGRIKPWGTAHAIYSAKDAVDGPFAVINADDYYGPNIFKQLYDYLSKAQDTNTYDYCMACYKLCNTLSEQGSVSRGIAVVNPDGTMNRIDERKTIQRNGKTIQYTLDGQTWVDLAEDAPTSMNFFGFTKSIFKEIEDQMPENLNRILATDPLKGEYYIPVLTSDLVNAGKAKVTVITSSDKWYGVTNKEDRAAMVAAMKAKTDNGEYPEKLWK